MADFIGYTPATILTDVPVGGGEVDDGSWYTAPTNIGGAPDLNPPVVILVSPQGATLYGDTPLVFTVTDDVALRFVGVLVSFVGEDTPPEEVHDHNDFTSFYQGPTNTRVVIPGGYQYTLLRDGGWPSPPRLKVFAVDAAGNMTS